MPQNKKNELSPKNHRLSFDMTIEPHVILGILKRHPLRHAFSLDHRVPEFYLQQFWYTMEYHPVEGNHHITTQIDDFTTILTPKRVRRILRLPIATAAHPFEDPVSEEQLCLDIRALGYNHDLPSPGQLKRMLLPQIWFTLFTMVNCCLTSKYYGMDKGSVAALWIFHGIIFNRHYDYAMLIWSDLTDNLEDKASSRDRKFVPFQRFFQLFIHAMLRSRHEIPRREGSPLGPTNTMKFLKLNNREFEYVMPIPEALLSLADQNAPSVIAYRERHSLMAQPPPVVPAQQPIHEEHQEIKEGPRVDEQVQDHGDSE